MRFRMDQLNVQIKHICIHPPIHITYYQLKKTKVSNTPQYLILQSYIYKGIEWRSDLQTYIRYLAKYHNLVISDSLKLHKYS